jgi:hypothetical protein
MSPNTHGMLLTQEIFDKDKFWQLLGVKCRDVHL